MHPDSGDPRACGEAWVADGDQQAVGPHGIARRVLADVDRIASLGASTALRVSAITAQARELGHLQSHGSSPGAGSRQPRRGRHAGRGRRWRTPRPSRSNTVRVTLSI
jgi:hypothetical protein